MKLDQIRVFLQLAESGSFTKAAGVLNQPISRVSRTVASLEETLETPLFYRTTRQLSLTPNGRSLFEKLRRPLGEIEDALKNFREERQEVSGTLVITAVTDMATVLAAIAADFQTRHPRIKMEFVLADHVVDLVRENIDLGLRFGRLRDSSLKSKALGLSRWILVASPAYLKNAASLEHVTDLANHAGLAYTPSGRTTNLRWKLQGTKSVTITANVTFCSNQPRLLHALAVAGKGIAWIPEFIAADALQRGQLVRVLENWEMTSIGAHFVWPAQKKDQTNVRAFIDFATPRMRKYFGGNY